MNFLIKNSLYKFLLLPIILLQDWENSALAQNGNIYTEKVFFTGGNFNCDKGEYKLVFDEEFDGDSIDHSKWFTYFPYGYPYDRLHGDNENQIYLDTNVSVENGICKLKTYKQSYSYGGVTRNFTAGMLHSNNENVFKYGLFEIRCKIPPGDGFAPAYWFFGDCWNEIDVFEILNFTIQSDIDHRIITASVHKRWPDCNSEHRYWGLDYTGPSDFSSAFHTFSIEWGSTMLIWRVDETIFREDPIFWDLSGHMQYCDHEILPGIYIQNKMIPNQYLNIILSNGVHDGNHSPPSYTTYPQSFEIDYVRVYQKPQATDSSECEVLISYSIPEKGLTVLFPESFMISGGQTAIIIFDVTGRVLKRYSTSSSSLFISTEEYTPGIYLLRFENDFCWGAKKFIVNY